MRIAANQNEIYYIPNKKKTLKCANILSSCSQFYSYRYARKIAVTAENITSLQSSSGVSIVWSVMWPLLVPIKVNRKHHRCPIYHVFPWVSDVHLHGNSDFGVFISGCNLNRLFAPITAGMRTIKSSP
jgi:hypothetical protein